MTGRGWLEEKTIRSSQPIAPGILATSLYENAMKPNIAIIGLFIVSTIFAQTSKKERKISFEETRDSVVDNSQKSWTGCQRITWHKRWTNYYLHENPSERSASCVNQYSIFEENMDKAWTNWSIDEGTATIHISTIKWDYESGGYNKKAWQINTDGSETSISGSFYIVTHYGCCDNEGFRTYYSTKTGKYIKSFNKLIDIGENKYFGYIVGKYSDKSDRLTAIKSYNGIGFLITDTSVISNVYVTVDSATEYSPKLTKSGSGVLLTYKREIIIGSLHKLAGEKTIEIEVDN